MPQYKTILGLALVLVLLAEFAAIMGIFSTSAAAPETIMSVRGEMVTLYGKGIYRHMPADVAPQGIAQDYVTLFLGIPLLFIALIWAQAGSIRARLMLGGVLGYFMLTYLFWFSIVMYNDLFLVYVILAGLAMNAFLLVMLNLPPRRAKAAFIDPIPRKRAGWFLIVISTMMAFLWLSVIVPPWVRGHYPKELYHFSSLIVQGVDLAYFLPFAFTSGVLLLKKSPWGYLFAPVFLVFLSLMSAALLAKLVYMRMEGFALAIPPLVIVSVMMLGSIGLAVQVLKGARGN